MIGRDNIFTDEVSSVSQLLSEISMYQIYLQIEGMHDQIEHIRFVTEYCAKILGALLNGEQTQGYWQGIEHRLCAVFPNTEGRNNFLKRAGLINKF